MSEIHYLGGLNIFTPTLVAARSAGVQQDLDLLDDDILLNETHGDLIRRMLLGTTTPGETHILRHDAIGVEGREVKLSQSYLSAALAFLDDPSAKTLFADHEAYEKLCADNTPSPVQANEKPPS